MGGCHQWFGFGGVGFIFDFIRMAAPAFLCIAWMLKDDYKRAGFKMLPVVYLMPNDFAQIMALVLP